jgi:hypothetical protein
MLWGAHLSSSVHSDFESISGVVAISLFALVFFSRPLEQRVEAAALASTARVPLGLPPLVV